MEWCLAKLIYLSSDIFVQLDRHLIEREFFEIKGVMFQTFQGVGVDRAGKFITVWLPALISTLLKVNPIYGLLITIL